VGKTDFTEFLAWCDSKGIVATKVQLASFAAQGNGLYVHLSNLSWGFSHTLTIFTITFTFTFTFTFPVPDPDQACHCPHCGR
jgi:hypothetical protein